MKIDGIGNNRPTKTLTTIKANDALTTATGPNVTLIQNKTTPIKIITKSSAENLAGFEEACANFAHITPADIRITFSPQKNINPDDITAQDLAKTNEYWGKTRGQPIEDISVT